MVARFFTDFGRLSINWINDGKSPNIPYPTGGDIDLSYGASDTCSWSWKSLAGPRLGLVFIKCNVCAVNVQIIALGGEGTVKLPCNIQTFS
jgi:hypothetical protein